MITIMIYDNNNIGKSEKKKILVPLSVIYFSNLSTALGLSIQYLFTL